MEGTPVLTTEIGLMLAVLTLLVVLFITEWVRIDVAAMSVMTLLGILNLVPPEKLFLGFSSNAVIAVIAIMIIGAGLDKAGVMSKVVNIILHLGGTTEKNILPVVLGTVAGISGFMQNIGAAALFVPVLKRIAVRTDIPITRLLMPMGFSAILGGTMTMVGCSSLIILNDLLLNANASLPQGVAAIQPFSLFAPLPIGLTLIFVGITYFTLAGQWVLPTRMHFAVEHDDYFHKRYAVTPETLHLAEQRVEDSPCHQFIPDAEQSEHSHHFWAALGFLALALVLIICTNIQLSLALFIGAMGMIISGVISVEEAYKRISWQTIFLLGSLIPLGTAVQSTGTADWVAYYVVSCIGDMPLWMIQTVLAILATCFTLVMSNVGTTILLVPLAITIAIQTNANPALFALTVALATSNTFLLPTHQVNALLMELGGYRVKDYIRAGGVMTVLFLVVLIPMLNLMFA